MQQLVIDANGHVPLPPDVMRKYGLSPGSRVNLDDVNDKLILDPAVNLPKRRSMHDLVGFLGKNPKSLLTLMKERKLDREKEDNSFGS